MAVKWTKDSNNGFLNAQVGNFHLHVWPTGWNVEVCVDYHESCGCGKTKTKKVKSLFLESGSAEYWEKGKLKFRGGKNREEWFKKQAIKYLKRFISPVNKVK